jgi:uncharacterized protein YprB with RNaseH-like and TPR domain
VNRDLEALRARIQAIASGSVRASRGAPAGPPPSRGREACLEARLPSGCIVEETPWGRIAVRRDRQGLPESQARAAAAISRCMAIGVEELAHPLYLDTETTGLSGGTGTVPFMVGLAWPRDGELAVEQYFLCDLDQERALLWAVGRRLDQCGVLVTYNGRSFDWPLLQTRLVISRTRGWPSPPHVDLLTLVRRLFRLRLPDCTLRTVEAALLALEREQDLAGCLIPRRYFGWLSGAPADCVDAIFAHNRQDVVSLAGLMARIDRVLAGEDVDDPTVRFARARYLEACGFEDEALAEYRRLWAEGRVTQRGAIGLRLARSLRRAGRWGEARAVLEVCWSTQQHPYPAAVELAKILEHEARDLPAARRLVLDALRLLEIAAAWDERWRADLERRRLRLDRRLRIGDAAGGELALTG